MLRGVTVGCGFFVNVHLEAWSRVDGAGIVERKDHGGFKIR